MRLVCESQWPSSKGREGFGLDTYKITSCDHNVRIDMDSTSSSDSLLSEWPEVGVSTSWVLNFCSQNLVVLDVARQHRL